MNKPLYEDADYMESLKKRLEYNNLYRLILRKIDPGFYQFMCLIEGYYKVKADRDSRLNHYRRIQQDRRMSDLQGLLCDRSWDI